MKKIWAFFREEGFLRCFFAAMGLAFLISYLVTMFKYSDVENVQRKAIATEFCKNLSGGPAENFRNFPFEKSMTFICSHPTNIYQITLRDIE